MCDNIARQSRVAEYFNLELGVMTAADAQNSTFNLNFQDSVISALVEYDAADGDLFTVEYRTGADCEAPVLASIGPVDVNFELRSTPVRPPY